VSFNCVPCFVVSYISNFSRVLIYLPFFWYFVKYPWCYPSVRPHLCPVFNICWAHTELILLLLIACTCSLKLVLNDLLVCLMDLRDRFGASIDMHHYYSFFINC
jgi:hypothetical protein